MPKSWLSKGFIVTLLVFTLIVSSFAFAKEGKKGEDEVLKLSLKDAIKIAEENNQQIKLSKTGLEKAELGRKQYRYQDKKLQDAVDLWEGLSPEEKKGLEQKMIEEGRTPEEGAMSYQMYLKEMGSLTDFETSSTMDKAEKQAEVGVKLAKAGIDVTVKGVQFGVEAAYYGALLARDNTAIAEAALERQKDMLRIAEAKYKVGTVAKTEVLDAQVQLAKTEADFLKALSEEEKAYINLKKLLGLSQGRALKLTDSFDYEPADLDTTLKELIEQAQKNRIDVMSAEGAFEIAKLDFDLSSKVYPSNTFIYNASFLHG
ncbi:MAG TPA: TolC family protein, partial [Thermoanaerobacterales bacterium]|nr:TolC family protein [Thermoanaerobacterales bacterium]